MSVNEFLFEWQGPYGLPEFLKIEDGDFADGFDAALKSHMTEVEAIADNPDAATFDNTVTALELAGKDLSRCSALFWNRAGTGSNDMIQELERDIAPRMARHYSAIAMNRKLFSRIDELWQ